MKIRIFTRSFLGGLLFLFAFFVFHSDALASCSEVTCRDVSNGGCNSNEVSISVCKAEKCDPYANQRPFPCASSSEVEKCGDVSNFGSQCKNSATECTNGTSSDDGCAGKFCPTGKVFCKAAQNNCPDLATHCVAATAGCADYDANCASSCAAVNPDKPVYCKSSSQTQTCGEKNDAVCKASCASTDEPVEDVSPKKCTNSAATACCKAKDDNGGGDDDNEDGGDTAFGIVPCGRTSGDSDQKSPCTLCHLFWGIKNIIDFAMKVLTFLAFTCLVIAGIVYIVSAGSDSLMTTAKTFIKNILFGFAIVLLAWLMINVVINYLGVKTWGWKWNEPKCDTTSNAETGVSTTTTSASGTNESPNQSVTCSGCSQLSHKSNAHVAIIQAGEHYNQNPCTLGYSDMRHGNGAGACGLSQVIPKWHKGTCNFDGSNEDMCYKLSTDKAFDSECGYKVIQNYSSNSKCKGIKNLALCYNGGPGHGSCGNTHSGKCYGDRVEEFYNKCTGSNQ